MGYSERRAQRRWAREMTRRLEELDRIDRDHGLGASPVSTAPSASFTARTRRRRGPVLPGLLIALLLATAVMLRDPGSSGDRLRELLGVGGGRLAHLVDVPDGEGRFRFSMTQPGTSRPVGWSPCEPVRYVVNPRGAPADWRTLVAASIKDVHRATGLEFRDDGTTSDRSFGDRRGTFGRPSPVLIGWADEDEVPGLAGDVAGLGGSAAVQTRPGNLTYVTGMVALDRGVFEELDSAPDGAALQRAILSHELGHVVGLAHVDDRGELMHEDNLARTSFGPGDLEGLARLGDTSCS